MKSIFFIFRIRSATRAAPIHIAIVSDEESVTFLSLKGEERLPIFNCINSINSKCIPVFHRAKVAANPAEEQFIRSIAI